MILYCRLFDLGNIVDLDISYNNLELIPRRICRLRYVIIMNVTLSNKSSPGSFLRSGERGEGKGS